MIELRAQYCHERMATMSWDDAVFIDEAGFDIHTLPGRGRSHIGDRIRVDAPSAPGPRLNMLVAISARGVVHFVARYGSTDRSVYIRFLTSLKTHALTLFQKTHVTIFQDGASIHKGDEVKDAVESGSSSERSLKLDTLPPHSSQLNPCEEFWSWLKSKVRKLNAEYGRERQAASEARKQERKRRRDEQRAAGIGNRRSSRAASAASSNTDGLDEDAEAAPAVRETELSIGKQDLIKTVTEALSELQHDQTHAASLCMSYLNHARAIWLDCCERKPLVE